MKELPSGYWIEEQFRGSNEVLLIIKSDRVLGSVNCPSYEDKVAWYKAMKELNSMLGLSSKQ